MSDLRFLVIAGTHEEFLAAGFSDKKDKYLAILPTDLLGYKDTYLVVTGTWMQRGDVILEELVHYCWTHNIKMPTELIALVLQY